MQGRARTVAVSMEVGRAAAASNFRPVVYYELEMMPALEKACDCYGWGFGGILASLRKLPPWRRWLDTKVKN